jgi:hypothetical protein
VPRETPWTDEWASLWHSFLALATDYLQHALGAASESASASLSAPVVDVPDTVRTHAVQLAEALVLSFSSAKLGTRIVVVAA